MSDAPTRLTRAEQQARTRERLLAAAADAFAEHGFDGASIDDITARAGFSRGAFYSNFADKSDLLVQLCEAHIDRFARAELPAILAVPEQEQLAAVARWLVQEEPPLETLLVVELARQRHRPEIAATLDRVLATVIDGIEGLLTVEGSQLAGLGRDEVQARSRAVLAAVVGIDVLGHVGIPIDRRVIELLLAGIADPEAAT